ncbi:MAG: DUF58 domain-containing protein [Oscillospiraceae bacterium]|nr:DUF58 domain-containing protein [Oscillospiraceae bacterium]
MKEFRIFFIIVFIILFVMCFTYHSRLMPFLLLTMFLICSASFIGALISRIGFSAEMLNPNPGADSTKVKRNDEVVFKVCIRNNFIFPMTPVRVYVDVLDKGVYLPQTKLIIVEVSPFQQVTLEIKSFVSFRGEYSIGLKKAEFFDILKIYRFKVRKKERFSIVAYPLESDLYSLRDDNLSESDSALTKPHDFDFKKDDFSHLREYREGESLRHIHWKLSAKLSEGDLIVKQMESNHDSCALVFCDFTGVAPGSLIESKGAITAEDILYASDAVIETALSVLRLILQNRNSALLLYQDRREEIQRQTNIADLKDYRDLIKSLASLPAEPYSGEFSELLEEYRGEMRHERAVYIITASVNDDLVKKIQELGLIFRKNVVLVIIPSVLNNQELIRYIETDTKITICKVETEEIEGVKK